MNGEYFIKKYKKTIEFLHKYHFTHKTYNK